MNWLNHQHGVYVVAWCSYAVYPSPDALHAIVLERNHGYRVGLDGDEKPQRRRYGLVPRIDCIYDLAQRDAVEKGMANGQNEMGAV